MASDGDGNLYVAGSNGIFRLQGSSFERLDSQVKIGGAISLAYHPTPGRFGTLWVGSGSGLWSFDGTTFTFHAETGKSAVWEVVTAHRGLLLLNVRRDRASIPAVQYVARTTDGRIQQLVRLGESGRFTRPAVDSDGNLYFVSGTELRFVPAAAVDDLFHGLNPSRAIGSVPPIGDQIYGVHLVSDLQGGVWVYFQKELRRYAAGRLTQSIRSDLLIPQAAVGPAACACAGRIWFLSSEVLYTIETGQLLRMEQEPNQEFPNFRGVGCDSSGRLMLGRQRGLRRMNPALLIAYSGFGPSPHPTGLYLRISSDNSPWQTPDVAPARLPFGTHTVRADAGIPLLLHPSEKEQVTYRFRLRGLSDDWQSAPNAQAAFTVNQPGRYRLEAALERNRRWTVDPASFEFHVDQQPLPLWFWPLAIGAIGAVAAATQLWRRRVRESAWGISDTTLGERYRIVAKIAETNLSIVFRALDTKLAKRPVALKMIRRGSLEKGALSAFRREVEALSRLRHRGIVSIYDVGILQDGRPFLVMELVDGLSLRALLSRGPLSLQRVAAILVQLGEIVAIAHANGILHRDLKPENVMLQLAGTDRESLVVLDFGTARIANPESRIESVSGGTLDYMAPEQLFGYSSEQTDIYACALLVFEMLTGKRLTDLMCENTRDVPYALRRELGTVSPALSTAVMDAILLAADPDPDLRPADVAGWSVVLGNLLLACATVE